jgi:hypothetical protein
MRQNTVTGLLLTCEHVGPASYWAKAPASTLSKLAVAIALLFSAVTTRPANIDAVIGTVTEA